MRNSETSFYRCTHVSVRYLALLLTNNVCVVVCGCVWCVCVWLCVSVVCVCVCVCTIYKYGHWPRVDTPGLGGRGRRSKQINGLI